MKSVGRRLGGSGVGVGAGRGTVVVEGMSTRLVVAGDAAGVGTGTAVETGTEMGKRGGGTIEPKLIFTHQVFDLCC